MQGNLKSCGNKGWAKVVEVARGHDWSPFIPLTGVRGMHVPCRYPDRCQGFAGTLQVSWPVSGVCRNWSTEPSRLSAAQGASWGDFLLAPVCPIENVTLWVGLLHCERQSFCPSRESKWGPWLQGSVSSHFTTPNQPVMIERHKATRKCWHYIEQITRQQLGSHRDKY